MKIGFISRRLERGKYGVKLGCNSFSFYCSVLIRSRLFLRFGVGARVARLGVFFINSIILGENCGRL